MLKSSDNNFINEEKTLKELNLRTKFTNNKMNAKLKVI